MVDTKSQTIKPSGFDMPIYGHQCALGTPAVEATLTADRARTGDVMALATGAFPGPDAWSPPI